MPKKVRKHSWRSGIPCGKASRAPLALIAGLILSLAACHLEEVPADSGADGAPVVTAGGERLQGEWAGEGSPTAVFKGIPYAAPPVGELRWRPPKPPSPRVGLQIATEYGSACIQDPEHVQAWYRYLAETFEQPMDLVPMLEPTSEDCLHLNVWTANLSGEDLWPVMVWIHGGSNTSGSPSELPYEGTHMTRKGVVVVSFNYRLNVCGFLAHPALTAESDHGSSGNYGLLDQIAALEWVQGNIAAFGGDPERVTIFGESAGATNIAYLMISPLAKGLIHRALMQSGGYAVNEYRTLSDAEATGERLTRVLGVGESSEVLQALRATAPADLLKAALEESSDWVSEPNIDGWVLEEAAARVFEKGDQAPVPLLIGFNSDEWTTLGRYSPDKSLEEFHEEIRGSFGELADRALELYPATRDEEVMAAEYAWQTDSTFACPSRFIADRVASASGEVFFYEFSRSLAGLGGESLGAYHGAETAYVMDNLALETWVPREEHDQVLADLMSDYWARFAATGNPNGGDNPRWPLYQRQSRQFLEFGDEVEAGAGIRTEYCDLYDDLQSSRLP